VLIAAVDQTPEKDSDNDQEADGSDPDHAIGVALTPSALHGDPDRRLCGHHSYPRPALMRILANGLQYATATGLSQL
jgi:hypothetical protein